MFDVRKGNYVVNPDLEKRFTYHAPKPGQPGIYTGLREQAKELAYNFFLNCPNSRELSLALTKLEEAIMWANAAIARDDDYAGVQRDEP